MAQLECPSSLSPHLASQEVILQFNFLERASVRQVHQQASLIEFYTDPEVNDSRIIFHNARHHKVFQILCFRR